MATLDRLDEWSELPEEIHVIELGVGDGQQAKVGSTRSPRRAAPAAATTSRASAT